MELSCTSTKRGDTVIGDEGAAVWDLVAQLRVATLYSTLSPRDVTVECACCVYVRMRDVLTPVCVSCRCACNDICLRVCDVCAGIVDVLV